ncbi:cupin domain-containing protein [Roseobacter weihaiensis]|uniref:cupin domain-containing protein n=1 Tax=Roseobacter weihaiensis TaxID=2763262 RepID=UPI001D0A296E|nr:cupin domain-containing protein [Roseobacter sp. H9]
MTVSLGFMRIETDGPTGQGLMAWPAMDPADLAAGTPVQHGYLYDEVKTFGYSAGVWECTAFEDRPGPYPVDEYMYLLEGQVEMEMRDGTSTIIKAGEAFVLPKGLDCQWKMPTAVRKVFMILDSDAPGDAAGTSLDRITVLRGSFAAQSGTAVVSVRTTHLQNHDRRMSVFTEFYAGPLQGEVVLPERQIIHVLEGQVTLDDTEGGVFRAGDIAYLQPGQLLRRAIAAGTRLLIAECYLPPVST